MSSRAALIKAYKKLSLVYHPDKTSGLSTEQKEECPLSGEEESTAGCGSLSEYFDRKCTHTHTSPGTLPSSLS